ncbi:hypothetical protein DLJ96_01640, partial [Actinotalea fermentans ATCC 43279 = JCM 9966 = DSM 3133]
MVLPCPKGTPLLTLLRALVRGVLDATVLGSVRRGRTEGSRRGRTRLGGRCEALSRAPGTLPALGL